MGAARKIQSEIDRTLKKVQEGIDIFDEIWEKARYTPLCRVAETLNLLEVGSTSGGCLSSLLFWVAGVRP